MGACLLLWIPRAQASSGLVLQLRSEAPLHVGSHATVELTVYAKPAARHALLITLNSEGPAIEPVRSRWLASDASEITDEFLKFRVPLWVRSEGTAVLRIDAQAYQCERTCAALKADAAETLTVLP
jgi:hypothetical protein